MQADDRLSHSLNDQLRSPLLVELADCVDDFVLVLDGQLRIAMSNRHATALFGYSESELAVKQVSTLVKNEERRRLSRFIRGAKERRGCEVTLVSRMRKQFKASLSISPLSDSGEAPRGYLVVAELRTDALVVWTIRRTVSRRGYSRGSPIPSSSSTLPHEPWSSATERR